MNKVTLNPGMPAQTKVVEVAPATPPTITLTLDLLTAAKLEALVAQVCWEAPHDTGILAELRAALLDACAPLLRIKDAANIDPIEFTREGGSDL